MKEKKFFSFFYTRLLLLMLMFVVFIFGGYSCGTSISNEGTLHEVKITDGGSKDLIPEKNISDQPKINCHHLCDCPQGYDCLKNQCITSSSGTILYCCVNALCPAGMPCVDRNHRKNTCPSSLCKIDLDCGTSSCKQIGEDCQEFQPKCINKACINQPKPYAKSICKDFHCIPRTTVHCKAHCDCPQGQYCDKGKCKIGASPVYCCDKPKCPNSASCFTKTGQVSTCPQKICQTDSDCGSPTCYQQGVVCNEKKPFCHLGKCGLYENKLSQSFCNSKTQHCDTKIKCQTHCDCPQSFTCIKGDCQSLSSKQTFCCPKPGCPSGKSCFNPDGTPGMCQSQTSCTTNKDCGTTSCFNTANSKDCSETTPLCDPTTRQCNNQVKIHWNATCDPKTQHCKPRTQGCKVYCDCPQGQGCFNGKCSLDPSGKPSYCCDKTGCPAKQNCQKKDGSFGKCPSKTCQTNKECGQPSCNMTLGACVMTTPTCDMTTGQCKNSVKQYPQKICKNNVCIAKQATCSMSHCDCPQGQYCYNHKCYKTTYPLYCCSNSGCPAGNRCVSRDGKKGFCPILCKTPCDCPDGQNCLSGQCKQGSQPVYCCDRPQTCPAGSICTTKNNKKSVCSSKPRNCKINCDCAQGEGCINHLCTKTKIPVYCCDKSLCPTGKICTNKLNQQGHCPQSCQAVCDCPQGFNCVNQYCQKSVMTGTVFCCDKPACPTGRFCYKKNGQAGKCPSQSCFKNCDCLQGEDCRNGRCVQTYPPTYCCNKTNCPSGSSCKDNFNKWSTCKNTTPKCTSPCDCKQGEDCYKGQCVQVYPPIYCCTKTNCPGGQACYDSKNQPGFCLIQNCKTACDCPIQGQSCVRGRCVYLQGSARIYCCDKQYCPSGNKCEDKQGNLKTCTQVKCKNACDCNQGEDCRNNQCVLVQPYVYCCHKLGCPRNYSCIQKDGSNSTCGTP